MHSYVRENQIAVEIGPGGGRWTQYLLGFGQLYVVDFYPELLAELKRGFDRPNMVFVLNTRTDCPGVPSEKVDYVFSLGCFVHLEIPLIEEYLASIRRILKPGGNAVIHYLDKTRIMASKNPTFVENTPAQMRAMATHAGFHIARGGPDDAVAQFAHSAHHLSRALLASNETAARVGWDPIPETTWPGDRPTGKGRAAMTRPVPLPRATSVDPGGSMTICR